MQHCINKAWLFCGVDMARRLDINSGQPKQFAQFIALGRGKVRLFERAFVAWRNDMALFMGPRQFGFSREGAALAASQGIAPRAVTPAGLQRALMKQGVYLRPAEEQGRSRIGP